MTDNIRIAGDIASIGVLAGTLLSWLPAVASVLTIIWTVARIWEMASNRKIHSVKWIQLLFRVRK